MQILANGVVQHRYVFVMHRTLPLSGSDDPEIRCSGPDSFCFILPRYETCLASCASISIVLNAVSTESHWEMSSCTVERLAFTEEDDRGFRVHALRSAYGSNHATMKCSGNEPRDVKHY